MCLSPPKDSVRSHEIGKINALSSRPAWGTVKGEEVRCLSGMTATRICVAICLVLTMVCLSVSFKLLADNFNVRYLSDILLSPYNDGTYEEEDFGLVGKILQNQKRLGKRIDVLSAWANNTGCIQGNGLMIRTKCIRLTKLGMKYDAVVKYCTSLGGFVAFIESEEEFVKILEYLRSIGFNHASELWVGLRKNTTDGVWRYSNGEVATFTKWAPDNIFEAGYDCALIRPDIEENAGMHNKRCSEFRLAMCQFVET